MKHIFESGQNHCSKQGNQGVSVKNQNRMANGVDSDETVHDETSH